MNASGIARFAAATLAGMAAVAIAVWIGHQQRPEQQPQQREATDDRARADCARRLADVGRALSMYAADHEGAFPVISTPAASDQELLALLAPYDVEPWQLLCPTSEEQGWPPYVYHSYRDIGDFGWPRWMEAERTVTVDSPGDTWLLADALFRDEPGPHSIAIRAFNYLRADGTVRYHEGRPRDVYK